MIRALGAAAAVCLALASCKEAAPTAPSVAVPVAQAGAAAGAVKVAEVSVTDHGFEPARVEVEANTPFVLRITRKADPSCADAVDVQGDPVRHMLPLGRAVDVKVTPPSSGQLTFACPMKMYRGAVAVVSAKATP